MQIACGACKTSHMEIDDTFRANLKALREAKGMNLDELARKAEVNRRGARDIEEGRSQSPKLSTVFKLAKALGVSLSELTGEDTPASLHAELVDFLRKYDEDQQAQILAALRNLPLLPPE